MAGGAKAGNAVELWRGNVWIGALRPCSRDVWQREGMKMKNALKTMAMAMAVVGATAISAAAATLSLTSGGTAVTLGSNFNPAPTVTGIGPGTTVTNFMGSFNDLGLTLDTASKLKITFLGKEASFTNAAVEIGGANQTLSNNVAAGTSIFFDAAAGLVNFKFTTNGNGGGSITNGVGGSNTALDLAFKAVGTDGQKFFVLFGDGGGNNDDDYDDWVGTIEVVPVPAAGFLMLGALGGLAALRRRKTA